MKTVTLKNGAEEVTGLVNMTMGIINEMLKGLPGILTAYELVQVCKDKDHVIFGVHGEELIKSGLMTKGNMIHQSIKNIVLSSVEGEGSDITFTDPRKTVNP